MHFWIQSKPLKREENTIGTERRPSLYQPVPVRTTAVDGDRKEVSSFVSTVRKFTAIVTALAVLHTVSSTKLSSFKLILTVVISRHNIFGLVSLVHQFSVHRLIFRRELKP